MKMNVVKKALAVTLAVAVIAGAGCNKEPEESRKTAAEVPKYGETTAAPETEATELTQPKVSETTEATKETETTEESTVETTEEVPEETEIVPDEFVQDDGFFALAKEIINGGPENGRYSFFTSADKGSYKTLLVKDKTIARYCMSGGQLVLMDEDYDVDPACLMWLTAEEMNILPFYIDLSMEAVQPTLTGGITVFTQSVEDGDYYGELLGFDEEGNKLIARIDKGITIDKEAANALQVGDEIGFGNMKVTSIDEGVIKIDDIYTLSDFGRDAVKYALVTADGKPVTVNSTIALLPVWGGCDVYNGELPRLYPDDYAAFEAREPYGSFIMRSFFYYMKVIKNGVQPYDGWYRLDGIVCPMSIYDGDVAAVTFGMRG